MKIVDFIDLEQLQILQDLFSDATEVAVSIIDAEGNPITRDSNFSEFCMKYTQCGQEGIKGCLQCVGNGKSDFFCHVGLMAFAEDIIVDGEKIGTVVGGQALPESPDLDKARKTAEEMGFDPDRYVEALKKLPVQSEKIFRSSAKLIGEMINMRVNGEYTRYINSQRINAVDKHIQETTNNVEEIRGMVHNLTKISQKQNILALNATIEAARAGEAGRGFNIVAKEMGSLSSLAAKQYNDIISKAEEIDKLLKLINRDFSQNP